MNSADEKKMPEEDDGIDGVLDSVESGDIATASKIHQVAQITPPQDPLQSRTAFNNPGSGRNRVATDIIDGSDRSMKAHAIRQEASYTDEYGQDHTGPKYQPGRVRKERWLAQHGKASVRLQVLKVKTDPPALVALRFAKEGRGWHLYTTSRLPEGTMFRAHGGGFGDQTIYIAEGSLWDYLAGEMQRLNASADWMFYDWPDFQQIEVDEGWVVRGERIDEKLLQRVIYTLGARHRIESP